MTAREVMSADEALVFADEIQLLKGCNVSLKAAFATLAAEVRLRDLESQGESITAIAIQIDGKPVYLPTWCAERVRKALEPAVFDMDALRRDAERWRKFRLLTWDSSDLFAVAGGKCRVQLGTDCPSHVRLDAMVDALPIVDAALAAQATKGGG